VPNGLRIGARPSPGRGRASRDPSAAMILGRAGRAKSDRLVCCRFFDLVKRRIFALSPF